MTKRQLVDIISGMRALSCSLHISSQGQHYLTPESAKRASDRLYRDSLTLTELFDDTKDIVWLDDEETETETDN